MKRFGAGKVPIRLLAVNGALLLLAAGCGPIVSSAPFNQRPDSVKVGSLLGPFEGQVTDVDTQKPIADAIVWCSWSFMRGIGVQAPESIRTRHVTTDADGRYRLPRLRDLPAGLSTRLSKFSLVVYKKGYVAYRHDRVFGQERPRYTFSQLNNQVQLVRWSPELSHARHLVFIGSGQPIVAASRWEVPLAVAELSGRRARVLKPAPGVEDRPPTLPAIDASALLSSDEVRGITGFTGRFEVGHLPGPERPGYDSLHLRAVERPERYDVAVRLWRQQAATLETKYEEILNSLEGSRQTDEVADRSFFVKQGEILGLGFLDASQSAVVLVTCGRGQCSTEEVLVKLAQQAQQNLSRLAPFGGEEQPVEDEEDEEDEEDALEQEEAP